MAIFNKSNKSSPHAANTTIIANGTTVVGEIDLQCRLHVDGKFEGNLRSDNLVTIGKTGCIDGTILAQKLVVSGQFQGRAECEEIEILTAGRVTGHISSNILVIERGSFFEGESRLREGSNLKEAGSEDRPKNNVTRLNVGDDKETNESVAARAAV